MERLLACPFCRELHAARETGICPSCGLKLEPMEALPPSHELLAEQLESGEQVAPEDRLLPRHYFGRGRGALLVIGIVGLVAFFLPWADMTAPEIASYSGFDLARGRAGWLWAGAVGWFILLPLVWTRRTIYKMRGVRIICAVFAAMTVVETGMMVALPPSTRRLVPIEYHWGFGLWLSLTTGMVGVLVAARFGGPITERWRRSSKAGDEHSETSAGQTLH